MQKCFCMMILSFPAIFIRNRGKRQNWIYPITPWLLEFPPYYLSWKPDMDRKRKGSPKDRKRIGNGSKRVRNRTGKGRMKDSSLRRTFHLLFFYPFSIRFLSFCDPIRFLSFSRFSALLFLSQPINRNSRTNNYTRLSPTLEISIEWDEIINY